ncbi:group-specific protein [Brachyspira murdochii]|uniref:group-specific protein n=1 Tax=Brachyspira murdochii TaxID=84378 RepID=UPI00300651E9
MIVYQIGSISFVIFSVICIFISITSKNNIAKAFYLICFFLSNIAALLCDILIKLNF